MPSTIAAVSSRSWPLGPPIASAGRCPRARRVHAGAGAGLGAMRPASGARCSTTPAARARARAGRSSRARGARRAAGRAARARRPRRTRPRPMARPAAAMAASAARVGLGHRRDDGVEQAGGRHQRHGRRDELGEAEQRAVRAGHARPGQRHGQRQRALQPLERRRDARAGPSSAGGRPRRGRRAPPRAARVRGPPRPAWRGPAEREHGRGRGPAESTKAPAATISPASGWSTLSTAPTTPASAHSACHAGHPGRTQRASTRGERRARRSRRSSASAARRSASVQARGPRSMAAGH